MRLGLLANSPKNTQCLEIYKGKSYNKEDAKKFYFLLVDCINHWGLEHKDKSKYKYAIERDKLVKLKRVPEEDNYWDFPPENRILNQDFNEEANHFQEPQVEH